MLANCEDEALKSGILKRIRLLGSGMPPKSPEVVRFIASEQASYINGSTIVIDGGLSASGLRNYLELCTIYFRRA